MKRLLLAAIVAMAASGRAWAQSSTTTGTGMGLATSTSSSQAISGQGGTGGGVAAITTNSTVPADQTVKKVQSIGAPGRGRTRNLPRLGFRRRRICRDRIQLRHHD